MSAASDPEGDGRIAAAAVRPPGRWHSGLAWAQHLIGTALLLAFGQYLWVHRNEFVELLDLSAAHAALLVALMLFTQLLSTAQSWLLLRAAGVAPGFLETFIMNCATTLGNYLPMRAGTVVRAHFLKEAYGLSYARFGSMFGVRSIITLFGTALLGLIGTVSAGLSGHRLSFELLTGFALMLAAAAVAWFIPARTRLRTSGPLGRILVDLLEGAQALRREPRTGVAVLILIMVQQLVLAARFFVATRGSGGDASFALLLLLSPVATLATYVAVTPGALGLREAAMGGATYAVGTAFSSGILLGTLDRTLLLVVVACMGVPSFVFIWVKLRSLRNRERGSTAPPVGGSTV